MLQYFMFSFVIFFPHSLIEQQRSYRPRNWITRLKKKVHKAADIRCIQINSEGNSQNSPFILGLGVPVAGLAVFSCDLEPAANKHKYGCHNEVMQAE